MPSRATCTLTSPTGKELMRKCETVNAAGIGRWNHIRNRIAALWRALSDDMASYDTRGSL